MSNIDTSEYVEAPEGATLVFTDEKQQANFELGVTVAVHSWSDLKVAVDNSWGGPDSTDKRDWISRNVIDLFADNRSVDIVAIAETLGYGLFDEFEVQLEDYDECVVIGKRIIDYFRECALGNYEGIHTEYQKWVARQQNKEKIAEVNLGKDPVNPDSSDDENDEEYDDDDEEDGNQNTDTNTMEIDQGPVVDDDGFELVQHRRGRR